MTLTLLRHDAFKFYKNVLRYRRHVECAARSSHANQSFITENANAGSQDAGPLESNGAAAKVYPKRSHGPSEHGSTLS